MSEREFGEPRAPADKKRIGGDHEAGRAQCVQLPKGEIEIAVAAGIENMQPNP
jgi:hypothetical protein